MKREEVERRGERRGRGRKMEEEGQQKLAPCGLASHCHHTALWL